MSRTQEQERAKLAAATAPRSYSSRSIGTTTDIPRNRDAEGETGTEAMLAGLESSGG